jgi:hypothetical protein
VPGWRVPPICHMILLAAAGEQEAPASSSEVGNSLLIRDILMGKTRIATPRSRNSAVPKVQLEGDYVTRR